jgi:hypothetical protein
MMFKDIDPRNDPKGGSPKTPFPIPAKQYYESVAHNPAHHSNGTIWKVATSGFASLFVGMTVAWWTARDNKGVSQLDMVNYVTLATAIIAKDNYNQDRAIGELFGKQDRTNEQMKAFGEKHVGYENSITEINSKLKYFSDWLEEQRKVKR